MTLIEYTPEFYDGILGLDAVKVLCTEIDTNQINGLGTILQNVLAQ